MAALSLPVLNVLVRYIITYCVILFTSQFGVENGDFIGDKHEHTTHNGLHQLLLEIMKSGEFFFSYMRSIIMTND
jgi:hypothetical protein